MQVIKHFHDRIDESMSGQQRPGLYTLPRLEAHVMQVVLRLDAPLNRLQTAFDEQTVCE